MSQKLKFEDLGLPDYPLIMLAFELAGEEYESSVAFNKIMTARASDARVFLSFSDVACEEAIAAFLASYSQSALPKVVMDYANSVEAFYEIEPECQANDPVLADIVLTKASSRAEALCRQIEAGQVQDAENIRTSVARMQEVIDESVQYSPSPRLISYASKVLAKADDALLTWEHTTKRLQAGPFNPRPDR